MTDNESKEIAIADDGTSFHFSSAPVYNIQPLALAYAVAVLAAAHGSGEAVLKSRPIALLLGLKPLDPGDDAWPHLERLIDDLVAGARVG